VSDLIRDDKLTRDQAEKDPPSEMVSVARRWILRAGLTAPVILTLRSKPLFAQNGCSPWMSATFTSHHADPGPTPEECK
jgi:hypothetical protein